MLRWRIKHNRDYRLICNIDMIIDNGRKGMKELMLGNKAVARGYMKRAVRLYQVIRELLVQRLQRRRQLTMRYIVNGHLMKRLH